METRALMFELQVKDAVTVEKLGPSAIKMFVVPANFADELTRLGEEARNANYGQGASRYGEIIQLALLLNWGIYELCSDL